MFEDWEISIVENWRTGGLDLYIFIRQGGKIMFLIDATRGVFEEKQEGVAVEKPSLTLPRGVAQTLLQKLTQHGVKPKDAGMTEGKLIATEKHLEDMRKVVFNQLKIK